jgi:hypothetical protein
MMKLIVKSTKPEVASKKQKRIAWTREEVREVVWCYVYCRNYPTDNYKNVPLVIDGRSESRN